MTEIQGRTTIGPKDRWFSDALGPSFENGYAREFLEFMCGERLGAGMSREVFEFAPNPVYVLKFESIPQRFQNVAEYDVWREVQHTPFAKWFAPIVAISGCGRILLQYYVEPIKSCELPSEVPAFFADLKAANWGMFEGHPVALDYGRNLLITRGLTKRMRKAKWT